MRQGSISSELLMCGGGVRSVLLLPLVARCLETIDVYGKCECFIMQMMYVCVLVHHVVVPSAVFYITCSL